MKRNIIIAILGLATVFATSSFINAGSAISSENITQISPKPGTVSAPLDGIWSGGYFNNFGPAYSLALTFDPNGTLMVEQAGSIGYGTYNIAGDQLEATYTITDVDPQYTKTEGEGDMYSLSGRVSGNNINGTLNGLSNGGSWMFSVNKE